MKYTNSKGSRRLTSVLAKSLVIIAFMNLNGFAYMLLGLNQIFSLPLLLFSVALTIIYGRITPNIELVWYLFLIFGYIFFGILFIPVFEDSQAGMGDLPSLVGTIILTVAIVQHIQNFRNYDELQAFFIFARNIALISAIANLFSAFLFPLYMNPPPSAAYRSAGLFANPNEAGSMGTLAVALLILFPIKVRILNLMVLSLVIAATVITFSRAAILVVLAILLASMWTMQSWKRLIFVPLSFAILISLLFNISDISEWLTTQSIFDLDPQQLERLNTISMIINGQIDTETSSGRSELFAFAFNKALSVFPLGTGLHSFQAMEGGMLGGGGQWLGAHNSFLMIWGEAGFLLLLVLIGFLVAVIKSSARRGYWEQGVFLVLMFLGSTMSGHEIFSLRFLNVVTAFMIAQSWASHRLRPSARPSSHRLRRGLSS